MFRKTFFQPTTDSHHKPTRNIAGVNKSRLSLQNTNELEQQINISRTIFRMQLFTCTALSTYVVVRSRFLPLFVHEFLGHYVLGIFPFVRVWPSQCQFKIKGPTILSLYNYPIKNWPPMIRQILSPFCGARIEYPSTMRRRKFINIDSNLWKAWMCLSGVIPEFAIYPALAMFFIFNAINSLLCAHSFTKNTAEEKKNLYIGSILLGFAFGFSCMSVCAFEYVKSTIGLLKSRKQFISSSRSGHDFTGACQYLYHYKKVNPYATLMISGSIYASIAIGSGAAGFLMALQFIDKNKPSQTLNDDNGTVYRSSSLEDEGRHITRDW